jgi:hypothetical protein
MPFILLGHNLLDPDGSTNYRGTARERPPYLDGTSDDSEYNRLVAWYFQAGGDALAVEDLARARRLAELLVTEVGRVDFELVEAVQAGHAPLVGGALLGYDLSCGWTQSLLAWGLELQATADRHALPTAIGDLLALVEAHFKPLLNGNGLFGDQGVAEFCLRIMMALQAIQPGIWENEECTFGVVAVYKIG